MKAVALQSTPDSGPAGKQQKAPWFIQPASRFDGAVIQRKSICACGGGCPGCREESHDLNVQTKLAISTPGDHYEQEADRVADQVMRMPDPRGLSRTTTGALAAKGQEGHTPDL